jgi:hypothetical protein
MRLIASLCSTALLVATMATGPTAAFAQSINVAPPAGSQDDTFTFTGSGFDAGTVFDERYISPAGQVLAYIIDGQPAVITTDDGGNFSVDVHPNVDFAGHDAGDWGVLFCKRDDPSVEANNPNTCYSGTIHIGL